MAVLQSYVGQGSLPEVSFDAEAKRIMGTTIVGPATKSSAKPTC